MHAWALMGQSGLCHEGSKPNLVSYLDLNVGSKFNSIKKLDQVGFDLWLKFWSDKWIKLNQSYV